MSKLEVYEVELDPKDVVEDDWENHGDNCTF
jgi:hypothetical protein